MTKIEELENKIKECQKEIGELTGMYDDLEQELKELKEGENKSKRWKPKEKEDYWYVRNLRYPVHSCWHEDKDDYYRYWMNNCFKTEEEAENYAHNLETEALLRKYAEEHNTEEFDWENEYQPKYNMEWDFHGNRICYSCSFVCKMPKQIYFTSEEIMKAARKQIGEERVDKYLKEM